MPRVDVVVVGQVGRDLVLAVPEIPDGGGAVDVTERRELLGGAVNQAVGCRQLGLTTAVVGVVGDDDAGRDVVAQARADGLDVGGVRERPGAVTALFVDVVEPDGTRRLLEHVPEEVRLTADDVRHAEALLRAARVLLVQAAQPTAAVREVLRIGRDAGALVVLDGAPAEPAAVDELLTLADVVRADAGEAPVLLGYAPDDAAATAEGARALVDRGPRVVALAAGGVGDVVAWREPDGAVVDVLLPLLGESPVDPTGGGDAFLAGWVTARLDGQDDETAAWWAASAATRTVRTLGGRPDLDRARVAGLAARARGEHGGREHGGRERVR